MQDEAGNDGIVELHADGKSMQPTIRERLDNKCLYVSIQTTFQLAYYCVPVLSLTPPLLPWASFQERDLTSPTSSPRSSPPMGTQTRMCAARARVCLYCMQCGAVESGLPAINSSNGKSHWQAGPCVSLFYVHDISSTSVQKGFACAPGDCLCIPSAERERKKREERRKRELC